MVTAKNPVLPGFCPDPSICRVGEDYYLAVASFAYAPGVPLFHSRDLAHWRPIGHALTRPQQLPLAGAAMSEGVYAPCLRHHGGLFYMISTNVSGGGNFYVTAADPAGEWSDPAWLPGAPGIDPSLFFDGEDCWYVGQRTKQDAAYFGDCEIWMQRLDLAAGKLAGPVSVLWDGALKRAYWPEGPHLYKIGGMYYLLIAEGGTEFDHSICVARSQTLHGPYEPCPRNPVFTHRHLGRGFPVQNVGHGDWVDTPAGDWYMVMLGTRPLNGGAEMGRETFLAEVAFEDGWPVVNPGEGKLREAQPVRLAEHSAPAPVEAGWSGLLKTEAAFFRFPPQGLYTLDDAGRLLLRAQPGGPVEEPVGYVGLRVRARDFELETEMDFEPGGRQEAGLLYLYDEKNHLRLTVRAAGQGREAVAVLTVAGAERELGRLPLAAGGCALALRGRAQALTLLAGGAPVAENVPVGELCAERAGGFVGCTVGVCAAAGDGAGGVAVFGPPRVVFG